MTPCDFRTDVLKHSTRGGCVAHGDRNPIKCANELRKELDTKIRENALLKDAIDRSNVALEETVGYKELLVEFVKDGCRSDMGRADNNSPRPCSMRSEIVRPCYVCRAKAVLEKR